MSTRDHSQLPPNLFPRQFGLKTVWLLVSGCGLLFALAHWLGPAETAAMLFVGMILGGHFLGSTLGTRLRAHGSKIDNSRNGDPGTEPVLNS